MKRIAEPETKSKKVKVLVVCIDGASFDIIKTLIKKEKLPNFTELIKNGVSGNLRSVFPPCSPVACASFITGKNPGKHGIFDFEMFPEGSYKRVEVNSNFLEGDTLWKILSKNGKRIVIINIPMTYPPEKVNGVIIPGETPFGVIQTYPRSILGEIRSKIPDYVHPSEKAINLVEGKEDYFLKNWYYVTNKNVEASIYLLEKTEWDFFAVYFEIVDQIQHFFWKYMDKQHPDYIKANKYSNVIFRCYEKMDSIIGHIFKKVDQRTIRIIMSDHGAGPLNKYVFINHWLKKLKLLNLKEETKSKKFEIRRWLAQVGLIQENLLKLSELTKPLRILRILPANMIVRLYHSLPASRPTLSEIDYSITKAFAAGNCGYIYLNRKKRFPGGIVNSGGEYEELRRYISKRLYELKDPETGKKIVDKVFKKEEIYWGPYVDLAADLFFIMNDMTYVTRAGFEFNTRDCLTAKSSFMESAWHRMNGMFMMAGENLKVGATINNAQITDLAPTILYIMGIPIPSDMDGRVLKDIFKHRPSEETS